jgi:hypothetical protein
MTASFCEEFVRACTTQDRAGLPEVDPARSLAPTVTSDALVRYGLATLGEPSKLTGPGPKWLLREASAW